MTKEHLPAKSTGNDRPVNRIDTPDLAPTFLVEETASWSDGHWVRTLCQTCNERASNWGYVAEYGLWHEATRQAMQAAADATGLDPSAGAGPLLVSLPQSALPARFVRQAVGMLFSVQAQEHLWVEQPGLRALIDTERGVSPDAVKPADRPAVVPQPPGVRLGVIVYNDLMFYRSLPIVQVTIPLGGGDTLWTPAGSRTDSADLHLIAFPPFMFLLTSGDLVPGFTDITSWMGWRQDQTLDAGHLTWPLPTLAAVEPMLRATLQSELSKTHLQLQRDSNK